MSANPQRNSRMLKPISCVPTRRLKTFSARLNARALMSRSREVATISCVTVAGSSRRSAGPPSRTVHATE